MSVMVIRYELSLLLIAVISIRYVSLKAVPFYERSTLRLGRVVCAARNGETDVRSIAKDMKDRYCLLGHNTV
jgi:hypothetical protein